MFRHTGFREMIRDYPAYSVQIHVLNNEKSDKSRRRLVDPAALIYLMPFDCMHRAAGARMDSEL